jgi:hypothetical protein
MNWQGKLKNWEKRPVPVPLCSPQIPKTDPGANPDLVGEKPEPNRLSHCTAVVYCKCWYHSAIWIKKANQTGVGPCNAGFEVGPVCTRPEVGASQGCKSTYQLATAESVIVSVRYRNLAFRKNRSLWSKGMKHYFRLAKTCVTTATVYAGYPVSVSITVRGSGQRLLTCDTAQFTNGFPIRCSGSVVQDALTSNTKHLATKSENLLVQPPGCCLHNR